MSFIELNFNQYLEKLNIEKVVAFPTEHVAKNKDFIFVMFRSREKIDYYAIINKEDIIKFSDDSPDAIKDFLMNYCSNSLPIKNIPVSIKPIEQEKMFTNKKIELLDFEDIVKMSKNYSDFLVKMFDKMEKEVLKSVNKLQVEKTLNKNFGEFLSDLFNVVNTAQFAKHVKRFLKIDVEFGRREAEKELKMDIPFNSAFEQKLMVLYNEQISGRTINGKKWFGIQGVTKEIQQKVIQTVQDGIRDNKSNADISKDVKETFDKFTDWRSDMIARTETNRIHNESKLVGYKESGLDGVKVWITAPYDPKRSSHICQRLKNKEVPLDEPFIDEETGRAFMTPPALPNCRSRIIFKPN